MFNFFDAHHNIADPLAVISLTNKQNSQFIGDIGIGKPEQHFNCIFDTGSNVVWIPGEEVKHIIGDEHNIYRSSLSSTNQTIPQDNDSIIKYGTGAVELKLVKEQLSLGSGSHVLTTEPDIIGYSTKETKFPFQSLVPDGIVGLARGGTSALKILERSNCLPQNSRLFSMYHGPEKGELCFGGINHDHLKGQIHWHKCVNSDEWSIPLVGIEIDGEKIPISPSNDHFSFTNLISSSHNSDSHNTWWQKIFHMNPSQPNVKKSVPCTALLDSGTSLIAAPESCVEIMKKAVEVHGPKSTTTIYFGGCDDIVGYPVSTESLLVDYGKGPELGITGTSKGLNPDWIFGLSFLKSIYLICDDDQGQIGLAAVQ